MPTFALDEKPRLRSISSLFDLFTARKLPSSRAFYLREEKRFSDEKDLIKQIARYRGGAKLGGIMKIGINRRDERRN